MLAPVAPTSAEALLCQYFLNREDVVAFLAAWGKPCPTEAGAALPALLAAHVRGAAAPAAVVQYHNRLGAGASRGHFRLGAYTPSPEGTTKWLCLDFDGGDHAAALANPRGTALAVQQVLANAGFPSYLELSGSGQGWHLWCFFDPPAPAALARGLARAVLPGEVELAAGEMVQANAGRVIEIFPKQTKIDERRGFGNLVWLPWWSEATWPANQFHRMEEGGELAPFVPESFATVQPDAVTAFVGTTREEAREERAEARQRTEARSWQEWRGQALAALKLGDVYGEWLTGKRSAEGWHECRDPDSPTGDRDPSAGVADGTGEAERGTFHSFVSGKSLSVFDFLLARGLAADFRAARARVSELTGVPLPGGGSSPPEPRLPEIAVNLGQLRHIIQRGWEALLARNDPPVLFRRGDGTLARLRHSENSERGPHSTWIESAEARFVHGLLLRTADWVTCKENGVSPSRPPHGLAEDMLALPDPRLPALSEVIGAPVFARDGTLIDRPGYHPHERLWYEPAEPLDLSDLPRRPTPQQIAAAKALLLDDLLVDFPFTSPSERAHALAALLQPAVRRMILGPTPAFLVEAPRIASGKGKLCDLISILHTGEECHVTTLPGDDDEARKRITSELALGRSIILLDNADDKRQLHYPSLAAVLTAASWSDRLLGESQMLSLPNRATWLMTANNPSLSLELARRCVRIRIDPRLERPWWREGFKHDPIIDWAKDHRSELLRAALTLVLAWIAAGQPLHRRRMGSFEHWSAVMGGILEVVEVPGFLGHLDELYAFADAQGNEWREFVDVWWEAFGDRQMSARHLLELALDHDLLGTVVGDKSLRSQQTRLGQGLSAIRDQQIGEWRVHVSHDGHAKSASYRLTQASAGGTCGTSRRDVVEEGPAEEIAPGPTAEAPDESAGRCGTCFLPFPREADSSVPGPGTRPRTAPGGTSSPGPATSRELPPLAPEGTLEPVSPRDVGEEGPAQTSREVPREAEEILDLAHLPAEWDDLDEAPER